MLLNGKSLHSVHSYSDWLILHRQVLDRFGEMHSWILYWNNWTLSAAPNQERARADLWLKYYGPMDRILLEQECAEVLEEAFKDFPLAHVSFHNLDRGKTGSVAKLWQELLTEFPIDKKRATFEFLARAIQSTQAMSVNTANEYTSFMYKMNEVEKNVRSSDFQCSRSDVPHGDDQFSAVG